MTCVVVFLAAAWVALLLGMCCLIVLPGKYQETWFKCMMCACLLSVAVVVVSFAVWYLTAGSIGE